MSHCQSKSFTLTDRIVDNALVLSDDIAMNINKIAFFRDIIRFPLDKSGIIVIRHKTDFHAAFLEWYTGQKMEPGDFVSEDGVVLGRHQGIGRYTIGQRKGLGVALGEPMYVINIDAPHNQVCLLYTSRCV